MSHQKSKPILLCHDEIIPISQIRVKKPYNINDNIFVFDISLDNQPLIIQTTHCIIPYSYYILDNKSFQLDVIARNKHQKDSLGSLNDYILTKVNKYRVDILQGKQYLNYIKEIRLEPELEYRIRLRNVHVNNITVFDNQTNVTDISTLQTFDKIICLFQIQKLIVQKETFYFQASVIQIKKVNTPLFISRECIIDDDDTEVKEVHVPTRIVAKQLPNMLLQQIQNSKLAKQPSAPIRQSHIAKRDALPRTVCFQPPSLNEILQAKTNLKPIL